MTTVARTPLVVDDRSGWWEGAPEDLHRDLLATTKVSDIGLLTEMTGHARQAVLDGIPGFAYRQDRDHGDASEIAMIIRSGLWRVLYYEAAVLGPDLGPGGREIAGIAVLEHVTTRARALVGKAHLPSAVQAHWDEPRAEKYRACVQKYRARMNALAKAWKVDAQLAFADWNLDLHEPWVRDYIAKAWPELDAPTPKQTPPGATHDRRLIDWFLSTGVDIEDWVILPRTRASDHKPTRLTAAIPAPKETPTMPTNVFAKADTKAQWFADSHPGSHLNLTAETMVVCFHTTEGTGYDGYKGGATAPNYTGRPDIPRKALFWRAHFPDDMSSRALQNDAGGVETNRLNVVQVELVGTCNPAHRRSWNGEGKLLAGRDYIYWPDAPDWALKGVAEWVADQHNRHGLQLVAPRKFLPYPQSYGEKNPNRLTGPEWRKFVGVCGHQHVPENDHGDPGDLDVDRILELARELVAPTRTKPKPVLTRGDDIDDAIAALKKATPSKTNAPKVKAALDSLLSITPKEK